MARREPGHYHRRSDGPAARASGDRLHPRADFPHRWGDRLRQTSTNLPARTTWWERAIVDGTQWHFVQLVENTGERVAGVTRCGCGKYRVQDLTVSPATAGPELTAAPTALECYEHVSPSRAAGPPLVAT
jgi:hypothetical protein